MLKPKPTYEELLEKHTQLQQSYNSLKAKYIATVRELDKRNAMLYEQNKELSDSINYALRIQKAILPPDYYVNELLPENFIYYKPKDVISGDFYFVEKCEDENKVVFSAVDCTGHGVPGAMMSVIGFKYLEQAVVEKGLSKPADILQYLDIGVNDSLRQTANESGVYDGMDLGLCTLDIKKKQLQYAGAYNSLYYVQDDVLVEIKADKLPIGVNEDGVADIFTNHTIDLEKGDTVYLFSDGYADQFGGPKGKKFKYGQLKKTLLEIHAKSMKEQKEILEQTITEWQGDNMQVDDILIIGIKI